MKKTLTLLGILLMLSGLSSRAQITIANSDMPSTGDIIRFSTASNSTTVNLTQTGANQTWDFSTLQSTGQSLDTFLSVTSTPITYLFAFGLSSNLAARGIQLSSIGFLPVANAYSFYNKGSAAYRQKGFGAEVNGLPIPVPYTNDDDIYLFPLNFGDQDTSDSDYSISIPGQGSATGNQRRINNVDGWGTVITPYGTFSALRVLSVLTGEDSLYLDTLGFGFSQPRALTKEYKWLANGQDIPVLQINTTTSAFGVETVSLIKYRDSLRVFASLPESGMTATPLRLFPNPVGANDMITIDWPEPSSRSLELEFYTLQGKLAARHSVVQSSEIRVKLSDLQIVPGVYLVKASDGLRERNVRLLVVGE
jgi:hypothetical protein